MSEARHPDGLTVGKTFVKKYYQVLSTTPEHIHKFYHPSSSWLSHGEGSTPTSPVEFTGKEDSPLKERFVFDVNYPRIQFEFENGAIDAQPSVNDGILLVATGHVLYTTTTPGTGAGIRIRKQMKRAFVHTIFLNSSVQGNQKLFYVHNDILRFLHTSPSTTAAATTATHFAAKATATAIAATDAAIAAMTTTTAMGPPAEGELDDPAASAAAASVAADSSTTATAIAATATATETATETETETATETETEAETEISPTAPTAPTAPATTTTKTTTTTTLPSEVRVKDPAASSTPPSADADSSTIVVKEYGACRTDGWKGSIIMPMDQNACGKLESVNLCNFIGNRYVLNPPKLYFDRIKFPPPPNGVKAISPSDPTFKQLRKEIQEAALASGSPVLSNGSQRNKKNFVCGVCFRVFQSNRKSSSSKTVSSARNTTTNADVQRRNGKQPKATYALEPGINCKFKMLVAWDAVGYYLDQKAGCPNHTNHPPKHPSEFSTHSTQEPHVTNFN